MQASIPRRTSSVINTECVKRSPAVHNPMPDRLNIANTPNRLNTGFCRRKPSGRLSQLSLVCRAIAPLIVAAVPPSDGQRNDRFTSYALDRPRASRLSLFCSIRSRSVAIS